MLLKKKKTEHQVSGECYKPTLGGSNKAKACRLLESSTFPYIISPPACLTTYILIFILPGSDRPSTRSLAKKAGKKSQYEVYLMTSYCIPTMCKAISHIVSHLFLGDRSTFYRKINNPRK